VNSDIAPDDLAARIGAIRIDAPADHIDLDRAVRAGTRRRRRRHGFVLAGVFACVVAATGSAFLVTRPVQQSRPAPPVVATQRPETALDRLSGRWYAVTVDGHDVTGWRDWTGMPGFLVVGADGVPNGWQVNRICGLVSEGSFLLGADGSFHATVPGPRNMSCPMMTTFPPDIEGALARTAVAVVDGPTLRLLDGHRKVVAVWRRDTTISSLASVCQKALGGGARPGGTFTTVDRIRDLGMSATGAAAEDVFPQTPGGEIAVYCESGWPTTMRYAVTPNGQKTPLRPTR
jgi:hypothetical protein